jgi:hypothetical protein
VAVPVSVAAAVAADTTMPAIVMSPLTLPRSVGVDVTTASPVVEQSPVTVQPQPLPAPALVPTVTAFQEVTLHNVEDTKPSPAPDLALAPLPPLDVPGKIARGESMFTQIPRIALLVASPLVVQQTNGQMMSIPPLDFYRERQLIWEALFESSRRITFEAQFATSGALSQKSLPL